MFVFLHFMIILLSYVRSVVYYFAVRSWAPLRSIGNMRQCSPVDLKGVWRVSHPDLENLPFRRAKTVVQCISEGKIYWSYILVV